MITLNWEGGKLDVHAKDDSYRYRALMQMPTLVLKFSLPEYIEVPVGASCVYQGETYRLLAPANIKKNGTRNIEFTLEMGTDADNLKAYKLRNNEDGRLKFAMCAKPKEFIRQIVLNLNKRDGDGVWAIGDCIDVSEKTIEFNHQNIADALSTIAEAFDTEWEISHHTISLRKVEYYKERPLPLSYGKGNGFVPGVGRTASADEKPIGTLFVQGGERNIDPSTYQSRFLLLPKGQRYTYEGKEYITSKDGLSLSRLEDTLLGVENLTEDSIDLTDIHPKRDGEVTSVETKSVEKHFYDIIDTSIPEGLNYEKCLIAGETMSIIFQSGMLSGREFDVKYKHNERRFEIVPQEYDGVLMPDETYKPRTKDKYAVYKVMLPKAYICDNDSKTGASWEMLKEACRYMHEHGVQKFTFSGELQGLWAKQHWVEIADRLVIGGYIRFSDTQFAPDGTDIRIVGIKDYLSKPQAPHIELSNNVKGGSYQSTINKVERQEVEIEESKKEAIGYAKRRFRDAKETLQMLEEALIDGYTESISPIVVQTMGMLIGDESLQFRFVDSMEKPNAVVHNIQWDASGRKLAVDGGLIQHMTLGIDAVSSTHKPSEYRFWKMPKFSSSTLNDSSKKYYLYARCSKTAQIGIFMLSENPVKMEQEQDVYHLLVGILNAEYNGSRSFVSLYGFTEILPGRITTDRIVSADGNSFFDMASNAMQLGNALTFRDGKLTVDAIATNLILAENAQLAGWVFRDGKLFSQDGVCSIDGATGNINGIGVTRRNMVHLTEKNIAQYIKPGDPEEGSNTYVIDFSKIGTLISVECQLVTPDRKVLCYMPYYGATTEEDDFARSFIGTSIIIYNRSRSEIPISGPLVPSGGTSSQSIDLQPNEVVIMMCKLRDDLLGSNGKEDLCWEFQRMKNHQ